MDIVSRGQNIRLPGLAKGDHKSPGKILTLRNPVSSDRSGGRTAMTGHMFRPAVPYHGDREGKPHLKNIHRDTAQVEGNILDPGQIVERNSTFQGIHLSR